MGIQVLADVILPTSVLAAGVQGKNLRSNTRTMNQGGYATVNINWTRTLREFTLGIAPMAPSDWQAIEAVYEVTDAGAYGFLLSDPKDSTVSAATGLLQPWGGAPAGNIGTNGLGYGVPVHRLTKRYTSAGSLRTKDRQITRPQATPALLRNGAAVTLGAAPGNAAIDLTTGTVTFVADTSQAIASITVGSTTVLNFTDGAGIVAALAVAGRVYLSGITGTAGAALNGLSHAITAKGATSLTISTSTAGLAVTAAGTAYKYPQPAEALAWSGSFYVPVHFVNDEIDWQMDRAGPYDTRLLSGPQVVVQEVRE